MDNNRIPITYQLFPGNTNDCLTFRPNLKKIKMDYNLGKVVVVADKGMTTGDNIWYTLSSKDGYVFSMSIRGADKELKDYVLNDCGYEWLGLNTNENLDFIPALFRSLPPTVGKWKCIGVYGKLKNLSM